MMICQGLTEFHRGTFRGVRDGTPERTTRQWDVGYQSVAKAGATFSVKRFRPLRS
jgi:hypothetical protein